ncbi:MAG: hypothetical protein NZ561_05490, partial [Phycisphaerae bacterium]|nr:hypothetical protein [Phycisphaerae bacterium]
MIRWIDRLLVLSASLRLAIVVILLLAAYLAVGAWYEARFGGRAARLMVYQSAGFYAVLALLALNVLAAAIVRFPWKRHQSGFLITHLGIEVLLLGCLIDARWGVDGRLILRPGQRDNLIQLDTEHVAITPPGGEPHSVSIQDVKRAVYPSVVGFVANLLGDATEPKLPAPARLACASSLKPELTLSAEQWHPAVRVETVYQPAADPSATVSERVLTPDDSTFGPSPAVRIRIFGRTPDGVSVDQAAWAAPGAPAAFFAGEIRVRFDTDPAFAVPPRGQLVIGQSPLGRWRATMYAGRTLRGAFDLIEGDARPAWMGLTLKVERLLPQAHRTENVHPVSVSAAAVDSAVAALRLAVEQGGARQTLWLLRGDRPRRLDTPSGPIELSYGFDAAELPFEIELIEATAAEGESPPRARVVADRGGIVRESWISPNFPVEVAGRRIYLTAVEQDDGPVAFLAVRHDPGWFLKYFGSGLIVLGTVLMFAIRRPSEAEAVPTGSGRAQILPRVPVPTVFLIVSMLLPAVSGAGEVDVNGLRTLPIEHAGRIKPLDTWASEVVWFITGKRQFGAVVWEHDRQQHRGSRDPLRTVLDWVTRPEAARKASIILLPTEAQRAEVVGRQVRFASVEMLRASNALDEHLGRLATGVAEGPSRAGGPSRPKEEEAMLLLR